MNLEFHYYIIYFLCKEAGFEETESQIISYSSQYVDNNLISRRIKTGSTMYITIPTQNYGWWDDYFPKNVYIPFHFFPGDTDGNGTRRRDGKKNSLSCSPGSSRVRQLLTTGLKTRNLYRVGIALHTYADSWAHQNFSGIDEEWNCTDQNSLIPHIGHAQVLTKPDDIMNKWEDSRLINGNNRIFNADRFLKAAQMIYKFLRTYNKLGFSDHDVVIEKLKWMTGVDNYLPSTTKDRINSYIIDEDVLQYDKYEWYREALYDNEINREDTDGFVGYDKLAWLKDALLHRTKLAEKPLFTARDDFYKSHYYKWNEAAKAHLAAAKLILPEIYPGG
ncbi:MAG: hypothetical protein JXJ04_05630 [Spirochaetales bacterium]|nr:hypothetical protein [Spirochaetales bacterium]